MFEQLDKELAQKQAAKLDPHTSYDLEYDGIRMTFHWNPFIQLNATEFPQTVEELEAYSEQRLNPKAVKDQTNAAHLFIGVGAWFSGHNPDVEAAVGQFSEAFTNLSGVLPHENYPMIEGVPFSDEDGMGPQIFFAPPAPPNYKAGNPRLKNTKYNGIKDRVRGVQGWLEEHAEANDFHLMRSIPELLRNTFAATVDPSGTGFHVIDHVADVKANLILNARCNAKLDRLHGYPYDRTCCTDYGRLALPQLLAIMLGAAYLVLCIVNEFRALRLGAMPTSRVLNLDVGIFVTALLACYWVDRTQAFPKGNKQFVALEFAALCIIALGVGLLTLAKPAPRPSRLGQPEPAGPATDAKPLSRDQTDEWKGWMQAIILIYHWIGGSTILNIYICVRLLVAAYLFQSGFGHAVYFVTKKDFSFKRIAAVLLRLNLLSCALPYIMNTDYMNYYFAPLITFWFLVIYAVFAIAPQYNDNAGLYAKMAIAAFICPGLAIYTPVMGWIFSIMSLVFRIQWDLHEWQFRLGLDGIIVYVGMLTGVASVQSKAYNNILTQTKGTAGIAGLASILIYIFASATQITHEKTAYNAIHPFVSFIPILGFIAIRNINASARLYYMRSMAWLGRCSLETFTLQFHIFLAADTKGILLLDIFGGGDGSWLDRWRSLLVIVPVFLWISMRVAEATNAMVKLITTTPEPTTGQHNGGMEEIDLDLESNENGTSLLSGGNKEASKAWFGSLSSSSLTSASDLRVRVGAIMALMWLMNLVRYDILPQIILFSHSD